MKLLDDSLFLSLYFDHFEVAFPSQVFYSEPSSSPSGPTKVAEGAKLLEKRLKELETAAEDDIAKAPAVDRALPRGVFQATQSSKW